MKRIFVLAGVLCLGILFTVSCQKDSADLVIWKPSDQTYGFAQGKKSSKKFEASAFAKRHKAPNNDYFFIHFYTVSPEGFFRENIVIGDAIAMQPETYSLEAEDFAFDITDNIGSISYFTSIDGGDV